MKQRVNRRVGIVFVAVVAVTVAQFAIYFPRLPERLATHFDVAGWANGWMSKAQFAGFQIVLLGVFGAVFGGLPRLLPKLPNWSINLPYRDHWLAPERRDASLADLAGSMATLGTGTLSFFVLLTELTLRANLLPEPRLGNEVWLLLGGFGIGLAVWVWRLLRRFPRPPLTARHPASR